MNDKQLKKKIDYFPYEDLDRILETYFGFINEKKKEKKSKGKGIYLNIKVLSNYKISSD